MDNLGTNNTNSPNQPQSPAGAPPTPPSPGPLPGATPGATGAPTAGPRPASPFTSAPTARTANPFLTNAASRPGATSATGATSTPGTTSAPGAATTMPGAASAASSAAPSTPGATAPTPAAGTPNPAAPATPDAKKKKTLYIILGCVAAVLVIACIIIAVVAFLPKSQPAPAPTPTPVQPVEQAKLDLSEMTADEMLGAFDAMQEPDYTLDNYLPELLQPYASGYTLALTDSYADAEDLELYQLFDEDYALNIETSDDETFSVLSALDEDGEIVADQPVYIAFNDQYLYYDTSSGLTANILGEPVPNLAFIDVSEEFVETALPILNVAYAAIPQSLTYDFAFDADDDQIIMTTYLIGLSYSTADLSDVTVDDNSATATDADATEYYVQGALTEVTVDLTTGEIIYADYDGSRQSVIAEFPIAEADFTDRYQLMMSAFGYDSVSTSTTTTTTTRNTSTTRSTTSQD